MSLLLDAQMQVASAPGTGAATLGAATAGSLTWAAGGAIDGASYSYRIDDTAGNWEIGTGTYAASGPTLTRNAVLASSNGGASVNFGVDAIVSQVALPVDVGVDGAETAVASAATADVGAAATQLVQITGTTTVTSFGTAARRVRFIRFAGSLTLTHDAVKLILPTAANITTAAGDTCIATSDGSGNWRVRHYQCADGTPLSVGAKSLATSGYQKLPGGLILQWGVVTGSAADQSVTFPTTFPNACFFVVGSTNGNPGATTMNALVTDGWSTAGFTSRPRFAANGGTVGISGAQVSWFALGW